ncbi:MAG: hypothetical protein A2Y07_07165 [Planctomycetes bacterium GWF2_50_10]|nr:MAG: hypothetical protein A2Y07_07165 [Planctomycetes bacterium GWF2_50_10]
MRISLVMFVLIAVVCGAGSTQAQQQKCPITPVPKSYEVKQGSKWVLDGSCQIVIGARATESEKYGAEQLQRLIKQIYGLELSIVSEGRAVEGELRIVMGQRGTNESVKAVCKKNNIKLDEQTPGSDGFGIETAEYKGKKIVLIGGSNGRGVIYGGQAFFELLSRGEKGVEFEQVSIRDWASIAWRGRPCEYVKLHDAASLDVCSKTRINWIDLRDSNEPKKTALFGYPAGEPFDKDSAGEVIKNAHRRGIFVYGTVSCGVGPEKFDAVIKTFEELIAIGVDGLWISFDDPGPGQGADTLVAGVIELGKKHGITGRAIAVTPPSGSYQEIDTNWNKMVAKAKGADEMLWLFTRVPCETDAAMMKKIGIKTPLAWWHNWPRPAGGLLHDMAGARPLYPHDWAYYELLPLSAGWLSPTYDELKDAAKYTDCVMLWQTCPPDYVCAAFGLWAWDPQGHDWARVQRWTYSYLYGAGQADAAREFDEKLAQLKTLFVVPKYKDTSPRLWPSRLKTIENRGQANKLLDDMDKLAAKIEANAPSQTQTGFERVQFCYIKPMRDTVVYGRKLANLEFPEYTLGDFAGRMFALAANGDQAAAAELIANNREAVATKTAVIADELKDLKYIQEYVSYWNDVLTIEYWKKEVEKAEAKKQQDQAKRKEMADKFSAVAGGNFDELFKNIDKRPAGKVLLEISGEKWYKGAGRFKGTAVAGIYSSDKYKTAAVAFAGNEMSPEGGLGELLTEFVIPNYTGRLWLAVHIAHHAKGQLKDDARISSIRIDRKTIWNQDLTSPLSDWVLLDITDQAVVGDKVAMRFFHHNKVDTRDFETIVFVGPALLIAK